MIASFETTSLLDKVNNLMCWTHDIRMNYGRNDLFGENAITKCGGPPIGFAAFEDGFWGIGFGGPL